MACAEDELGHEPGNGDVGGGRNPPPLDEFRRAEHAVQEEVDGHRAENAADGCEQGGCRLPEGVKIPPRQTALGDLRRGNGEEENHEYIVGDEVKIEGAQELLVVELVVGLGPEVGPHERHRHPGDERKGKFA